MPANRMRLWFALFVLVVFAVGLAGGILIGRRLPGERPFDRLLRGPRDFAPSFSVDGRRGQLRHMLVSRMSRDLDLTPEQQLKVDAVLESTHARIVKLQKDAQDRYDIERRSVLDEIRRVLTPAQQQKLDQIERDGRGRRGRRGR